MTINISVGAKVRITLDKTAPVISFTIEALGADEKFRGKSRLG
ncbi:hypothetical protein N9W79_01880 [bacterium]|nr:hypothetical protein [bacterium]